MEAETSERSHLIRSVAAPRCYPRGDAGESLYEAWADRPAHSSACFDGVHHSVTIRVLGEVFAGLDKVALGFVQTLDEQPSLTAIKQVA